MDHDYSLPFAARPVPGKRKRTGEPNDPRRLWDKKRGKTRVNIGVAFPRWRELRDELGLQKDAEFACILLDSYEKYMKLVSTSKKSGGQPQPPPPPSSLSSSDTESQSNEKRFVVSITSSGTCMQESAALLILDHVSASEKDKQCQQDNDDDDDVDASEVDCLRETCDEMEVPIDNDIDECNSVKNRESDLHSDVDNVAGTAGMSAPEADDNCDEEIYVPVIAQRSKMSEFLLECEEEELEPWQKHTSQVHLKVEDVGELSIDHINCKPDPASLHTNATPPKLKEESPQPVVFNSQSFIVASPQLTSNTEFIGSPGNSLPIVKACQQQLFHKVSPAVVTPEAYDVIHTSEVQQVSNDPLSLSSVQSPAVYATPSDQTSSQTLSEPFPLSCFTILELKSNTQ